MWQGTRAWVVVGLVVVILAAGAGYLVWRARTLGPLSGDWGPLAVSRTMVGGDFARAEGVIRRSGDCVFLEARSGRTLLLIWSQPNTRWDGENGVIRYQEVDGWVREIRADSEVVVGGSGELFSPTEAEAIPWDTWVRRFDWAAAPNETCAVDGAWAVGSISNS